MKVIESTKNALLAFIIMLPLLGFADDIEKSNDGNEKDFDVTAMIDHHISDAHSFHIAYWNEKPISMPLPVILFTNKGIITFMSSEFHHNNDGKVIVERKGLKFISFHEKIYQLNEGETTTSFNEENYPSNIIRPLNFSITKNVFSMMLSAIILLLVFSAVGRSYKKSKGIPQGLARFLEPLVTFVRDDIARPNIGEKNYARFMPYLLTIFFFVWINNLIGLVPFFPGSANMSGNIVFTGVLALFTFLITIFNGNKNYWSHIFAPPIPKPLYIIMIPIEIIGMLTKPFALMIRLFANITAGHIIILSLVSLIFIFETVAIAPVSAVFLLFMNVLELLVAALQAFVFTLLSALFIGQAVEDHH